MLIGGSRSPTSSALIKFMIIEAKRKPIYVCMYVYIYVHIYVYNMTMVFSRGLREEGSTFTPSRPALEVQNEIFIFAKTKIAQLKTKV